MSRLVTAIVLSVGVSAVMTSNVAVAANDTDNDARGSERKRRAEWVYTFPVDGPEPFYPRDHLNYPAADIAGCGKAVRAPISGVVFDVRDVDRWVRDVDEPGTRGGITVTLHGDDFVRYYFSHLAAIRVKKGQRVESGQRIGTVGSSGNARYTHCHLHFGVSRICPMSEQNILRGEIWPQPYLDAWRAGINLSPNPEVRRKSRKEPRSCLVAAAAQRRGGDG